MHTFSTRSFALHKIASISAATGIIVAGFFVFGPLSTTAATDATLTVLINGAPSTGFCIAGPITVAGSGTTGGQGNDWHLVIGWGDGTASTTSDGTPSIITSGSLASGGSAFTYSASHTPVGSSSGITVILYHAQPSGQDGQVIVVNQCVAPPTQGVVVLAKHVVNDNSTPGTATAQNFTLTINGNNVTGSETGATPGVLLDAGTYQITETGPDGYTRTGTSCGDGTATTTSDSVTVVASHNYVCTVTNNDTEPTTGTLHVVKHVITDKGGTAVAGDFSVHVMSGASEVTNSPQPGSETGTDYTLAGGSYTVSETGGPAGYSEDLSACGTNGTVTVTNGQTTNCTITNDDQAATITVDKTVSVSHGGTATASSFQYFVDTITEVFNGIAAAFAAGPHTLSESALTGYLAGPWGGDCGTDGTIALVLGQNAHCTITNSDQPGTLVVKKVVVGGPAAGHPENFSFQVNGGGATAFNESGENDLTEDAGHYTVTEVADSAYATGYDNCGTIEQPVVIANGATSTCTITNTFKTGKVIVVKNTVGPDGANTSFSFTTNYGSGSFSLVGGAANNDSETIAPGNYSVTETPLVGWDQTSAVCDGEGNTPDSINLRENQTVTCTFTNTERGHIIVQKVTDPSNSEQSFHFTANYSESGFDLSNGGSNDSGALVPGTYNVSENVPAGWVQSNVTCSNEQNPSEISLSAGEAVTCIFTNTQPPTLTIVKHTSGGNGPFNFSITGATATTTSLETTEGTGTSGTIVLNPGTSTVAEILPEGWTFGGVNCIYNNESIGISVPPTSEAVHVDNGDTVICTFNNTLIPTAADLSVTKSVDDATPDVGQTITYTITVADNGPANATGVVVHDALPSGLTFVSTSSADTVGVYDSTTGNWTIGSLGTGSPAVLHISATVGNGTAGQSITNTASISASSNSDSNAGNNSGSSSVTVNTPIPTPHTGGGGGGGGGGSGGCTTGFVWDFNLAKCVPKGQVQGASTGGQVLGASTSTLPELPPGCTALISTYMRRHRIANDPAEVKLLQQFLNDEMHTNLPTTGFFGPLTDGAVRSFQLAHADQVLNPWNLTAPTGFVYLTTQRWINLIHCASLNIPMPNLVPFSH